MSVRKPFTLRRPQLGPSILTLLVSLFIVLADNRLFWSALAERLGLERPGHWGFLLVLGASYVLLLNAALLLTAFRPATQAVLSALLVIAAAVSYFSDSFGVVIDRSMIHNILETNPSEAVELLTWPLLRHLAIFGVIPAALVAWVRLPRLSPVRGLVRRIGAIAVSLLLVAGLGALYYKEVVLFGRANRDLLVYLNPYSPLASARSVIKRSLFPRAERELERVAGDAARQGNQPRTVVVLAIGETARASEFSLNGYERSTNPLLSSRNIVNFPNVEACGTATAESVPCIFSLLDRQNFNRDKAARRENLLDIVQRVGVKVLWRDNDSGSKGVASRVAFEEMPVGEDEEFCAGDNCYDEALLQGLAQKLTATEDDMLIVLHMKGSHGPSYYKRSPPGMKVFQPECSMDSIQDCSRESIVNAYDNTIVYTDYVLARLIDLLQEQEFATAMLYVSDHGESLGENGLYLHGLPYAIAPREQTRVPMIFWASDSFARQKNLSLADLTSRREKLYSHDYIFHSILALFDIDTKDYSSTLDLFSESRQRGNVALN